MSLSQKAPVFVELDDGIPLRIRPLMEEDGDRIKDAYERLSEESRLNRFWEKREHISEQRVRDLSRTDDWDHFAWIALHESDDQFPGYGGASCWRDSENPERAEISFTVADEMQRKGIGTLLLSILWFEAWDRGIREFYGIARRENQALVEWFVSLGAEVIPGSRHVEVSLKLQSPDDFVNRIQFGLEFSSRRIILAEWMQVWLAMTDTGSFGEEP